jgi:hypothetical protein
VNFCEWSEKVKVEICIESTNYQECDAELGIANYHHRVVCDSASESCGKQN